ncbi:MAG: flavin reductase family protein, partial [Streptomycetaceae bacterium]|nr:flavin reductase family protein [Streptomycetaceae bacterium]
MHTTANQDPQDRVTVFGSRAQSRALRTTLGRFPTGVTVLTTVYRGTPVGVTVNSFTSVSLDPPLILWCLRTTSASRDAFTTAPHFAVNILAAHQADLATRFATPGDRFQTTPTRLGPNRLPLLDDTAATLICRRHNLIP